MTAKTKTLKQLVEDAILVQDACNLSGVARGFVQAIDSLRQIMPTLSGRDMSRHPIMRMWANKIQALTIGECLCQHTMDDFGKAYGWCRDQVDGTPCVIHSESPKAEEPEPDPKPDPKPEPKSEPEPKTHADLFLVAIYDYMEGWVKESFPGSGYRTFTPDRAKATRYNREQADRLVKELPAYWKPKVEAAYCFAVWVDDAIVKNTWLCEEDGQVSRVTFLDRATRYDSEEAAKAAAAKFPAGSFTTTVTKLED
jgi:hypothetical protein